MSAVVSNLKDWKCGRYFREMLIEEVEAGRDLSRTAIEKVLENAVGRDRLYAQSDSGDFTAADIEQGAASQCL